MGEEGEVLAAYLRGAPCPRRLLERYRAGVQALGIPSDGVVTLAARRAWLLPLLDAGAAAVDPRGPLRERLLLMHTILECEPDPEGRYEPPEGARLRRLAALAGRSLQLGVEVAAGVPLYLLLRRRS